MAAFTLTVDSNVTRPVLGQSVTLNLTLTRTGNGSEWPSCIDVAHGADVNITWAYQFVSNVSEYMNLQTLSGRSDDRYMLGTPFQRMYLASTAGELEDAKTREEDRVNGWFPLFMDTMRRNGYVRARHNLWEDDKEPQETYSFGMEVNL